MRRLSQTMAMVATAILAQATSVRAQSAGDDSFRWYFGAHVGLTIFETPAQTRAAVLTAGGNVLITAKRTGLILAVEEGITTNQATSFADATAPGGVRQVRFNDLRKYSATVVAFPFKSHLQPYFGVGFGILQTANEYSQGFFATQADQQAADSTADAKGTHGFGSFVVGLQARAGTKFTIFGQYMITTAAPRQHLLTGPSHAITGGIRIGLGSSRGDTHGGGY
jgi:hypothetical protein